LNTTDVNIAALLPHAGSMLLIDRIDAWDAHCIQCCSDSHRKADHPLRAYGHLSALHLIEYGAQAMGLHGGLLKGTVQPGYLAALRNVRLYAETLDNIGGSLHILATAQGKSGEGAIYRLCIRDDQGGLLLEGRATVVHY
jgi:predicted hotdog family 3-hydroxylacyl-ACP dehydratase